MEIKYFEDRNDWRKWLIDNFETANEIWFVFPGKSSGKKSITYNDSVENIKFSISHLETLKAHTHKPTKKDLSGYWEIKWCILSLRIKYEMFCLILLSFQMI